ncbi:hypothetical protein CesoFtcFv8_003023 [Champsocephalus esox]|uniref:Uncharacterized protein n=1 Tax=Champsocephalus esox TaxID=159716 RepID=A0AAN8HF84_9TELE|nr:hypothetical protein CesoFtcFv8_003023 [Champsocephalus esox]
MVPAQDGWENKGLQDLFLITLSQLLCSDNRSHVRSAQPGEAVRVTLRGHSEDETDGQNRPAPSSHF